MCFVPYVTSCVDEKAATAASCQINSIMICLPNHSGFHSMPNAKTFPASQNWAWEEVNVQWFLQFDSSVK